MKIDRKYSIASIATQMIVVPILLTLALYPVSAITQSLLPLGFGENAKRFILLLIAALGSLILGGMVGFIFSRRSKVKPASAKARYLPLFIPILYALIFALLAVLFSNENYNSGWWGIYILKNPVFLIFGFVLFFSGLHFLVPIAELMGYTGFVAGVLLQERTSNAGLRDGKARNYKMIFTLLCVTVVVFSGIVTREVTRNGILELRYGQSTVGNDLTQFDLLKIAPFKENNGLAKLNQPASLQFTELDSMPRLDGATAAYPVYGSFVEAVYKGLGEYYATHKNDPGKSSLAFIASEDYPLNIVKCSKTDGAYDRLIRGETDVIFVAEPSKAQLEAIKAKGDEFILTPIGSEAFVFFTNINNPVEGLSVKQIQDIYSGKITNWKEVGGPTTRILPYQRPENSGSQTVMQNKVMKSLAMLEPTKETYAGGMGDMISRVASYKNAKNSIGYSFMYYSTAMVKSNQIKYLAIDGVKPTPGTVQNKTYPFTVSVYAVTLKSNTKENVNRFVQWIISEEGQSLVRTTGYVPVK